jgi:hypothetical protein
MKALIMVLEFAAVLLLFFVAFNFSEIIWAIRRIT